MTYAFGLALIYVGIDEDITKIHINHKDIP